MTLRILDKYTKNPLVIQPKFKEVAFSQKGDSNKKIYEHYNKELCTDKKCYNCSKTGCPASHFRNNSKETPNNKKDEKKSTTSRSIKSSRSKKSEIKISRGQ